MGIVVESSISDIVLRVRSGGDATGGRIKDV